MWLAHDSSEHSACNGHKVNFAMSEHPYIRVVYQVKEIPGTYGMDVLYECVEIVRTRGPSLKYSSGNYQTDISLARIDGAILNNLQEHHSLAAFEKLVAAKPKERYRLIMSGQATPPS
jgi:hypothetical protein